MPQRTQSPSSTPATVDDGVLVRQGLSSDAVAERIALGLTNASSSTTSRSVWAIIRTHVFTLFNLVLGLCAAVIIALGRWLDLLFCLAAVSNVVIGFVQEYSAKRQLDRIALLRRDPARVLRDGATVRIPLEEIVLDDVLLLSRGDQVPADAVVLEADGLDLDESLLTGENDPVVKRRGDQVFSASSVTGGAGKVRVTAVGEASHASRLTTEARQFAPINSELRASLARVVRWLTIALLPIVAVVLNGQMQAAGGWQHAFTSGGWEDALVAAVSSVASMIPQGLALMTTISFAVAAVKLARDEVLIQEQPAVEVLARVDTVCFDKTGTLTEGGVSFDAARSLTAGAASSPGGVGEHTDAPPAPDAPLAADAPPAPDAAAALAWFGADPHANPTAAALAEGFEHPNPLPPVAVLAFSSANRFSGVEFPDSGAWILGAPEVLLAAPEHDAARGRAHALAAAGMRTMVLSHAPHLVLADEGGTDEKPRAAQVLPTDHEPQLLLTFSEQVRSDARQTLEYFREQGVDLKVLSGDNPATVAAAAATAGMDVSRGAVDASTLPEDGEELHRAALEHSVFGRVSPHQKKNMVLGLQQSGRVVAMTGDGINDALALKHADLGIAMGNAAPATKAVSRLVLLDGQFSRLPSVLGEGRKIIANIERVTNLFLTKTGFAVMMGLALGLLAWTFPFLPRQYSTADALMIGIPSFVLTMLPNTRRYVPGYLRRALHFALPSAAIVTLCVVGLNFYERTVDPAHSTEAFQTASFMVLVLVGLWVLCVGSRPLTPVRLALVLAMYAGLVLVLVVPISLAYHQFELPHESLFWASLAIAAAGSVLVEINFRVHTRWLRRTQREAYREAENAQQQ
ncbi:HAD family hydrolase [Kocuria rhizophila]|uniref:HAD family hydrolase n=1 Tax=Kocuria rhizophila TaxID=72000 RepID=A0AAX2SB87_KOCRH|nr:HAD-IC family P-type ATPase [Kocuria rhizophila]MXN62882.1 HAD-IC family P-type ATPase [Bacillus sp. BGMRC0062]TFI00263.1 HAD family hydrolase [Kocuria rhizophila]TFI09868.1 HAD family hydrolase [Kocuria rhizophila]WSQ05750.1 HAD-IC family P-type ATPase [Kocuria rhizophila]